MLPSDSFSQQSAWTTDRDGWVLRKTPGSRRYEKFFAIGLWNVPGYTFTKTGEPDSEKSNAELFLKRTASYNMTFVQAGYQKDYMNGIIQFISSVDFPYTLNKYLDGIPQINQDKTNSPYIRMQYIRKDIANPKLRDTLDGTITRLNELNAKTDHVWAPIDEIANGGGGDWNWPTGIGDIIYDRIKSREKHTLVFTDLMGVGRGNSFLFEQRYLKSHGPLPPNPPFELLSEEARACIKKPLLGFRQAYNGLPVYDFKNGEYSYRTYDIETLKSIWYENVRLSAAGFKRSGDVFGINAFRDFDAYPILAGITVDAIKAGTSSKTPVWLYFDGNGYAKSPNVSPEEYVKNVKCQMYTSIIHGATGILFWNDRYKTPAVFDALEPVIKELNGNRDVICLKTVEKKIDNDLHFIIKKRDSRRKFVIASNTSKTNAATLDIPKGRKIVLKPLEVYISPL